MIEAAVRNGPGRPARAGTKSKTAVAAEFQISAILLPL